jgi:MoaA/NifB/PqqE/SkfB family radical SAM enzyme
VRRGLSFAAGLLGGLLRPGRISYAVFFITDLCNAKCPYCFNTRLGHLSDHVPAEKAGTRLTADEYARIARRLRPLFQVVFGGGEPFLRDDIDELAAIFHREAGARLISIPTNAALPERVLPAVERMARRCPGATFNIQVSLDAVGGKHDRLRVLPGGFEKALSVCDALLEGPPGVNLVVNTAVTRENAADVPALAEFLRGRFAGKPWFHNVQYEQRALPASARPAAQAPAPADGPKRRRWLSRWYVDFINSLILKQLEAGRMLYRCNAGSKVLVVMPDGAASACEPFFFDGRYAGFPKFNVRDFDYDPRRIQADPRFREMRAFIAAKKCAACPWSCAAITSMTYSPSNWPLFLTA